MRNNPRNDMRNTAVQKGIVANIRTVKAATGEFQAIRDRLERNASPELIDKSRKALSALESALPPPSLIWKMDHSMEGMVDDSPLKGVSRESHLVRRMGGPDAIAQNARKAKTALADFERALAEETSTAAVLRSRIRSQYVGRWSMALSVCKKIASGIAVAATGLASYMLVRYGVVDPVSALAAAAGGGAAAAAVLAFGQKSCPVPEAKKPVPEAYELRKDVLPRIRKALEGLA